MTNLSGVFTLTAAILLCGCGGPSDSADAILNEASKLLADHNAALADLKSAGDAQAAGQKIAGYTAAAKLLKARLDKRLPLSEDDKKKVTSVNGHAAPRAAAEVLLDLQTYYGGDRATFGAASDASAAFAAEIEPVLKALTGIDFVDTMERLVSDNLQMLDSVFFALASAKDEASAKAAVDTIQPLIRRISVGKARAGRLPDVTAAQRDKLNENHLLRLNHAMRQLKTESTRIANDPKLKPLLSPTIDAAFEAIPWKLKQQSPP